MRPWPHRLRVLGWQQAAAHEHAQQPPAHLLPAPGQWRWPRARWTTALAIVVALVIGTIELLQVFIHLLDLSGGAWDLIAGIEFGVLGYVIVGLFLPAWAASVAMWKFGRFEQRYGGPLSMHLHAHAHADGTRHTHEHVH